MRGDHPLASKGRIAAADLKAFPLASPAVGGIDVNQMLHDSSGKPVQWQGHFVCEDIGALKTIAMESAAVLMLSDLALERELQGGELLRINPDDIEQNWSITLAVAFLAGRRPSPAAVQVVQQIKHILLSFGTVSAASEVV
ncbi:LysR substrate-binding domain-containing protein [Spongiibacter nanhainus]|uniref:LysR substrate-binding domain-containing protein n=1 Tax=Spongiibacter nanhainus TaxID=2794344 RepID=UPI001E4F1704|nr:LysR substrate-binding domain-containing protein [Spongiibacter nanhainus]